MTLLAVVALIGGLLLLADYRPSPEHAYDDVIALREVARPGFLRELHRWGGQALAVALMVRLYVLSVSVRSLRPIGWGAMVLLLVVTLALCATGTVLPWDRAGRELAGPGAGEADLRRAYLLHCVALPLAGIALVAALAARARGDDPGGHPGPGHDPTRT